MTQKGTTTQTTDNPTIAGCPRGETMPRVDDDAIEMRLEAVIDEVTEQDLREYFAHVEAANRVAEARAAEMGVSFGGGW